MSYISRTILPGLLLVGLAPVTPAQTTKDAVPPISASSLGERGAKLAENGRCGEALPLLKKSFPQISDKDLKLRVGFGAVRCAMTLNQPDLAVDFLRVLNREFPRTPEVLYLSVHIYSDLSTRASQELANVAPTSAQAMQLNAEALEVQGKWDEAEKVYREIVAQDAHVPGIHFRLGRLILSKPESPATAEDARKEFLAELEIDPRNAGAEYVLGELAQQSGATTEAIDHLTRATRLDSSFADAFLGLGICFITAHRYAEAIPTLESAVRLQPANPAGHYQLAVAYSRVGRKEDANREAALQRETTEKLDLERKKAAEAVQGRPSGQDGQKPEPQR